MKANDIIVPSVGHFTVRGSRALHRRRPRRGWNWSPAPPVPATHGSGSHLLEFQLAERYLLPPLLKVYLPTWELNSDAGFSIILFTNEFSPILCCISAFTVYHFYWILFSLPNYTPKTIAIEKVFLPPITIGWLSGQYHYFGYDYPCKETKWYIFYATF